MTELEQREVYEISLNSIIHIKDEYLKVAKLESYTDAENIEISYRSAICNLGYSIIETMRSMKELRDYLKDKSSEFKYIIEDWIETMLGERKDYSDILNRLGI